MTMELFIFLTLTISVVTCIEKSQVEDLCSKCVENGTAVFIKSVWIPTANPEYVCRENPRLISKFGIVIERICDKKDCIGIHGRPITQVFSRHELACKNSRGIDYIINLDHLYILEIVRDYCQILFMVFVVCVLFHIRRSEIRTPNRRVHRLIRRGDPEWRDPVSM
jgi:hypothetical protein